MNLAAAFQNIHALLRGDHRVAVEIRRPLLEFGEVLDGLQGPLRAEQALNIDSSQRGGIEAVAKRLGANIADQVRRPIGVAVDVAVETGHSHARLQRPPIIRGVELLLGEGSHQQPQSLQLLGVQNPVEQVEVFCSVTTWPWETSPRSVRVVR